MLIRRLRLEEGVMISKGKCILQPGYGKLDSKVDKIDNINLVPIINNQNSRMTAKFIPSYSSETRYNEENELMRFYKPLT